MAIPSRKNQMIKQMIQSVKSIKRDRTLEDEKKIREKNKSIDEDEHKKRIDMLKNMGLLK